MERIGRGLILLLPAKWFVFAFPPCSGHIYTTHMPEHGDTMEVALEKEFIWHSRPLEAG
jgi:hypothetical protein